MKKVLKQAFAREEAARVRELTANVKLGNRKPGDLLRDMQQLAVTTDERMLKNLWLQQLPVELGAALATRHDLPITQLRDIANCRICVREWRWCSSMCCITHTLLTEPTVS